MSLTLKSLWRASFSFSTGSSLVVANTWVVAPNGTASTAVYPYPDIYNVGITKAALIKSIVLTNVTGSDLVVAGIYTGLRSVKPGTLADLTTAPTNGITSFQRIAPINLRVPAGQQVILDNEFIMIGMNVTNVPSSGQTSPVNDYLAFVTGALVSGTVANGIECVVNGAERDQ